MFHILQKMHFILITLMHAFFTTFATYIGNIKIIMIYLFLTPIIVSLMPSEQKVYNLFSIAAGTPVTAELIAFAT